MSVRREYESVIIINAALEDDDIENVIQKITNYIENHGGNIQEINRWGRRRLAYPINKKYNGFYVHIILIAFSNTIPILERFLILEDTVLRHLTKILPKKVKDFRHKRSVEQGKLAMPQPQEELNVQDDDEPSDNPKLDDSELENGELANTSISD